MNFSQRCDSIIRLIIIQLYTQSVQLHLVMCYVCTLHNQTDRHISTQGTVEDLQGYHLVISTPRNAVKLLIMTSQVQGVDYSFVKHYYNKVHGRVLCASVSSTVTTNVHTSLSTIAT